jgi:uncharacterized protein YjbJ (UPF0337 family)
LFIKDSETDAVGQTLWSPGLALALESGLAEEDEVRMMSGPSEWARFERGKALRRPPFEESRMNRLNPLRLFPTSFTALALLLSPLGCGSETHETPIAETPALPATVDGSATMQPAPSSVTIDPGVAKVDREIERTAGDVKEMVGDVKSDARKAAESAEREVKKEGEAIKEDARKSAESALDNLLGTPK